MMLRWSAQAPPGWQPRFSLQRRRRRTVAQQRIVLLDGAKTIGAKILVSGGSRCNVTHEVVSPLDFFGNRRIIKNVLAGFSVEHTVAWFASLGVELKREETGKLFPVTDKARTFLTLLSIAVTHWVPAFGPIIV